MPPVIHVDTDAPLYSDIDGSLITDKLWGLYYKPDFHFGGVQGGALPYKVADASRTRWRSIPMAPTVPDFVVGDDFIEMWCSMLAHLPEALRGQVAISTGGRDVGRHRLLHAGQLPGVRRVPRECLCDRRLQSRLQDDRRRQAGGAARSSARSRAARAVPLLALREGKLHPVSQQPVSLELMRSAIRYELVKGRTTVC